MLNLSNTNRVREKIHDLKYDSLGYVESKVSSKVFRKLAFLTLIVMLIVMFLPWTQNIQTYGKVVTIYPEQSPQIVNSFIAGTVNKWYVKEGDYVKKGDTILFLNEIKSEYLDPNLIQNTSKQKELKQTSIENYKVKSSALEGQIDALTVEADLKLNQAKLKLQQAKLKVESDSISHAVAVANLQTIKDQFTRMEDLQKEGLKSVTDMENRNIKLQDATSYEMSARNKLLISKSELINAQVDLNAVKTKYQSEIAKATSELSSANAMLLDAEIGYQKLDNQLSNYTIRNNMYYVLAPQNGYVTHALVKGVGETVKEGEGVVTISPEKYDFAVEMYVDPIDLPLMNIGQHVRIQFDGWPAIVFSGWPGSSYGTYGGEVYAIDRFIGENGKYRVLIAPDEKDHPWPTALRYGGGTLNFAMLQDVPVWYELWRKINGFPPEFYSVGGEKDKTTKY
ncbi:MAG: HlyD family efflux transporter periplasmic adaptor subunit [Flavobacteriales bacterium]|nr:HlyD family efflux transporter periplasmic adaptor subunit [Flavobacteriales bacterium]MCB9198294.1 HlyD family efflux transporter periplasmic adaptor subunit [Flavobacteriales bacterium]